MHFEYTSNTLQWFLFQIYFLDVEVSAALNLQVFALSCEFKETTPFSFNDVLDCIIPLEGIPGDYKVYQSYLGLFLFSAIFSSK